MPNGNLLEDTISPFVDRGLRPKWPSRFWRWASIKGDRCGDLVDDLAGVRAIPSDRPELATASTKVCRSDTLLEMPSTEAALVLVVDHDVEVEQHQERGWRQVGRAYTTHMRNRAEWRHNPAWQRPAIQLALLCSTPRNQGSSA